MKKVCICRPVLNFPGIVQAFSENNSLDIQTCIINLSEFTSQTDIDTYLSDVVCKIIDFVPDLIFIPTVISAPLGYYGVKLALHCRFESSTLLSSTPIILMGFEDEGSFFRNCEDSFILRTRNSYFIEYNNHNYLRAIELVKPIKDSDKFDIENYCIKPPNELTDHSITNEWCILRWASALDASSLQIQKSRDYVSKSLYFKYLQRRYPIAHYRCEPNLHLSFKGDLFLIDDEVSKGWDAVFKKIINIKFEAYGHNFKDLSKDNIISRMLNEVTTKSPDVVILDLRLHDSDIGNLDFKELTGYKILLGIKEINPGIQVIIFSATTKALNLLELLKVNIDGFILKETPLLSCDHNYTEKSIGLIFNSINDGFKVSFLKLIYSSCRNINDIIQKQTNKSFGADLLQFYGFVSHDLTIGFELACNSKNNVDFLSYAYIHFFKIIEDFLRVQSVYKSNRDKSSVFVTCHEVIVLEYLSGFGDSESYSSAIKFYKGRYTLDLSTVKGVYIDGIYFKVSALLFFRYGDESNQSVWSRLNTKRNSLAHGSKNDVATPEDIYTLLKFILFLLDLDNLSEFNISRGLH